MPTPLHIESNTQQIKVQIPQEFDGFLVDKVRDQLDALIAQNQPAIILDLSHTTFIDSSGIGAIVFLYKRLVSQNRTLHLQQVNGQPLKLMTMLHVDRTIPVNVQQDVTQHNLQQA